ncbi:MAG: adenosylcobinamide-GDP ribazoletransferase [Vulcanimicrobiaceae bacterium]
MTRALETLGAAFGYFSILPIPHHADRPPDADALVALPLVGVVLGGLAGLAGLAAEGIVPHGVAAAVALAATIVGNGALHLDGFLDGCDAFVANVAPERRLEILKDPRHGTFAVAGMWIAGSLWYAALVALPARRYPALLAFAGGVSRLAAVTNAVVSPARRGDGAAAALSRPTPAPLLATGIALTFAGFRIAPPYVATVPAAALLSLALGGSIARRLGGGLVGDAYGFVIVVLEIGVLVALSAAGTHSD